MSHGHGSGLTPEQAAEALQDPYEESPRYGHITVGYIAGLVFLFGLARVYYVLRTSRHGAKLARSSLYQKNIASWRYFSYTSPKFLGYHLSSLGVIILMLSVGLPLFIWTWAVRPYYYSLWSIGSPPLAQRTGFMAFSSKYNIITFITGVSHEKLLVLHGAASWAFFFLGLVHTIPYAIQGSQQMHADGVHTQIEYSMFVAKKVYYWTGVALNVLLFWLCVMSLPPIRRYAYEFFKYTHILAALLVLPFYYLHGNHQFDHDDYVYAAIVLFAVGIVGRFGSMLVRNSGGIPHATFESLPSKMVKVRVHVSPLEHWAPGQHVFFNFFACSPLTSHPFTVASIPSIYDNRPNEMVLLIREEAGLTRKLRNSLSRFDSKVHTPVLIDGPYGGILKTSLTVFDHVLLIAGGSGISFVLPMLQDLVWRMRTDPSTTCKTIDVIWSIKEETAISWIDQELREVLAMAPAGAVTLRIHVTSDAPSPSHKSDLKSSSSDLDVEKAEKINAAIGDAMSPSFGRADLSPLVATVGREQGAQTVGIAACGPPSLLYDVRNAAAHLQKNIVMGKIGGPKEVFLHTEEFTW